MSDRDGRNDNEFNFEKDVEFKTDVDLEFDSNVDVYVDKDVYVDVNAYSDIDLEGNSAELSLDVQAIGDDSDAESIVSVQTTDDLSSISVWAFSAVD